MSAASDPWADHSRAIRDFYFDRFGPNPPTDLPIYRKVYDFLLGTLVGERRDVLRAELPRDRSELKPAPTPWLHPSWASHRSKSSHAMVEGEISEHRQTPKLKALHERKTSKAQLQPREIKRTRRSTTKRGSGVSTSAIKKPAIVVRRSKRLKQRARRTP